MPLPLDAGPAWLAAYHRPSLRASGDDALAWHRTRDYEAKIDRPRARIGTRVHVATSDGDQRARRGAATGRPGGRGHGLGRRRVLAHRVGPQAVIVGRSRGAQCRTRSLAAWARRADRRRRSACRAALVGHDERSSQRYAGVACRRRHRHHFLVSGADWKGRARRCAVLCASADTRSLRRWRWRAP